MTKYVIDASVALALAAGGTEIARGHQLLAPTLLRSQVLAQLYALERAGRLSRDDVYSRLDYLRGLRIRLLGDRVMQRLALEIAAELRFRDTYPAEYLALTILQADAFVTKESTLAKAARKVVAVAKLEALLP